MNAPAFQIRSSDLPPVNTFRRTLAARIIASVYGTTPSEVMAKLWPQDRITAEMIERAATTAATTFTPGWAAELAQRKIVDTLDALYQESAAAKLFARSTVLTFDDAGAISVPGFVMSFGNRGFVAEGQPIPVQMSGLTIPDQLKPTKAAGIVVLTREMIESSNAEKLIADVAIRMLGRAIDEILVDANPADQARPRGLRQGVAALTPVATAGSAWENAVADMGALADAVAPVAGAGDLAFIGSAGRALKANIYLQGAPGAEAFGSGAVINDFLCIATAGLIAAVSDPSIESSRAATLHMDDTPNIDPGSAGRHSSMYQTDSVAIKMRMPVSWAVRDPRGFAWMTPTGW